MLRNRNPFDIILVGVLVVFVAIVLYTVHQDRAVIVTSLSDAGGGEVVPARVASEKRQSARITPEFDLASGERENDGTENVEIVDRATEANTASEKAVNEFKQTARLDFEVPGDFTFKQVDADDYLIVQGSNKSGHHLTMMAGRVSGPDSAILPFLQEHLDLFQGRVNKSDVAALRPVMRLDDFNQSGDVVILQQADKNKTVLVGVLKRNDGLGSYMFVLEGDSKLKDNTDRFEDVFSSLRAK